MTPALSQLRALLALRWSMLRTPGMRWLLVGAGLVLLYLLRAAVQLGPHLEHAAVASAIGLAPAAFLGFAVLAVVAPLTAGGGSEIVPPDQLVAFPVRARTHFLGGLALAPLNLVWALQLITLTAETALVSRHGSGVRAALTATAFVVSVTVLGQAVAWGVAGLRQTRAGRRLVTAGAVGALLAAAGVIRLGVGSALLDRTPTHTVVHALRARSDELPRWWATTGGLLLLAALGLWVGARLCAWALRRPHQAGSARDRGPVRRRALQRSALRELVAVNRANAWRAPALRRGALVLLVLPGVAAAGAGVPWASLTVLPGLVAAGAGLLFGVNAFALDASGALWLASLPHHPRLVALAKVLVLAETVGGAVAVAAVTGSVRSPGTPNGTQVLAIVLSGAACTAVVVAVGMARSVRRPHHALLAGPRDSIAPPGALAMASLQLSLPAACVGVLFEGAAQTQLPWVPLLCAIPVLMIAALSLRRSLAEYDRVLPRARVVAVVSAG